ncbi:MAG: hypothetical protein D6793_00355 [Thermoflexia bacterium]|nr:MAG: hypothetical protein D6793_00355 [Thermoflexia bacterium]
MRGGWGGDPSGRRPHTEHGLLWNYEYGIRITDPACVCQLREDLLAYGKLGSLVSRTEVERLTQIASSLKALRQRVEREATKKLADAFRHCLDEAETKLSSFVFLKQHHHYQNIVAIARRNSIMSIRASGKTTNGIFADTIVYLLRKYGPM